MNTELKEASTQLLEDYSVCLVSDIMEGVENLHETILSIDITEAVSIKLEALMAALEECEEAVNDSTKLDEEKKTTYDMTDDEFEKTVGKKIATTALALAKHAGVTLKHFTADKGVGDNGSVWFSLYIPGLKQSDSSTAFTLEFYCDEYGELEEVTVGLDGDTVVGFEAMSPREFTPATVAKLKKKLLSNYYDGYFKKA